MKASRRHIYIFPQATFMMLVLMRKDGEVVLAMVNVPCARSGSAARQAVASDQVSRAADMVTLRRSEENWPHAGPDRRVFPAALPAAGHSGRTGSADCSVPSTLSKTRGQKSGRPPSKISGNITWQLAQLWVRHRHTSRCSLLPAPGAVDDTIANLSQPRKINKRSL